MTRVFAALTLGYVRGLMRSLREVAHSERRAIVIVLHNIKQAVTYANHIVALEKRRRS